MKDYLEKRRAELKKRGNKGFTLMEMLIVVAIIAVLIAIAIPIFTSQLENSREATDAANLRSAYAEVSAAALTQSATENGVTRGGNEGSYTWTKEVKLEQAQDDWQNDSLKDGKGKVGEVTLTNDMAKAGKTALVVFSQAPGAGNPNVTISIMS